MSQIAARELGVWETLCSLAHDQLSGTGIIFSATHLFGNIDLDLVTETFKLLYHRHPLLKSTINQNDDKLFFNIDNNVEPLQIDFLKRISDEQWKFIIEDELNKSFENSKCLWRLKFLYSENGDNNHELILIIHHSIADGLSCINLVHEFLTYYSKLSRNEDVNVIPLDFLPCIEKQLDRSHQTLETKIPNEINNNLTKWAYQEDKPLGKRLTRNIYKILEPELLNSLVNRCHSENTTINAALNAAMLYTAHKLIKQDLMLPVITPVNLRKYCNPPISAEHFGCYISCVMTMHNIHSNSDFWEIARTYEQQLNDTIPIAGFLPASISLGNLGPLAGICDREYAQQRKEFIVGIGVTNKGQFYYPEWYGPIQFKAYFSGSSRQAGDIAVNLSITTLHKKVYCCFSYVYPLISNDWANRFVEIFMLILMENIGIINLETLS